MIGYHFKFPVYIAFLFFLTVGCSTIQPLDGSLSKQEVIRELHVGSQIKIQTKSGEHRSIIVSSISETHIESSNEQFTIEEIEIIGLRKTNIADKAGGVAMIVTYLWLLHVMLPALIAP